MFFFKASKYLIISFFILFAIEVQANCAWSGSACSSFGSSWATSSSLSSCSAPANGAVNCCCGPEEVGCCEKKDTTSGNISTADLSREACQKETYAKTTFYKDYQAVSNKCLAKEIPYDNCIWKPGKTTTYVDGVPLVSETGGCGSWEKSSTKCLPSLKKDPNEVCCCSTASGSSLNNTTGTEAPKKPLFILPELQVSIPGLTLTPSSSISYQSYSDGSYLVSIPWIAEYIKGVYQYGLSVVGILAAIILMAGGFMWLISRGDASKTSKAKELIAGSLTGLIIMMTSYSLLTYINPDLTKLKSIEIGTIKPLMFDEPSEAVLMGQTKGMECFFNTFGNSSEEVEKQLVTVTLLNKKISVHKKAQAAFETVAQEIKNSGYAPEIGTFNWRPNVNNPSSMSLHSFGIALDFDTAENDNYNKKCKNGMCKYTVNGGLNSKCSDGETCQPSPCMTNIPVPVQNAFKKNGFRWGGDYKNTCDAMHFEWIETCLK